MVLVRRLGGWRPVDVADGVGTLRRRDGRVIAGVRYWFEVWHQVAQGFHGVCRSEGRVWRLAPDVLAELVGQDVLLELDDGRFLPGRIGPDAALVAHTLPSDDDPWAKNTTLKVAP